MTDLACPKCARGQLRLEGQGVMGDGTRVNWVSCDTCSHWARAEPPDIPQPSLFDEGGGT